MNTQLDYGDALAALRPGEPWSLCNNDLATLVWLAPTTRPTDAEINTQLQALKDAVPIEAQRVQGLNTDSDYLDFVSRLQGKTAAQVKSYVQANVTDLASARLLLAKVLLYIARTI